VWRWDQQEPFGDNPADENPSGVGAFNLPLRLPGQYYDAESGLHYNYYRDYDPIVGRYAESDFIGLRAGPNTYAYVRANPLLAVDPLGLKLVKIMEIEKRWIQFFPSQYLLGGDKYSNPGNTPQNNSHQIYLSTQWGEVDDDCEFDRMTESRFSGMGSAKPYAFWDPGWRSQWLEVNLRLYYYKKSGCNADCTYKHVRFDIKEDHWAGADPNMNNLRAVGGATVWRP